MINDILDREIMRKDLKQISINALEMLSNQKCLEYDNRAKKDMVYGGAIMQSEEKDNDQQIQNVDENKIDELIRMIDGKMDGGVNRLSVGFTKLQKEGDMKEKRSMGKSDSWYPWVWGEGFNHSQMDEE